MHLMDIEAVMAIEHVSFPTSWSAAGYRHELTANQQAHYIVLEVEKESGPPVVIGYAGHWIVAGEAHISTIAVAPPWRGKGLGAALLIWMIYHALANDVTVVGLEVREGNKKAQALYASYGFLTVGRRRRYYRETGEDALLMDLDLTQQNVLQMLEEKRISLWEHLRVAAD
jgi:ribosomal-protein-alanine N-acetyltransferase